MGRALGGKIRSESCKKFLILFLKPKKKKSLLPSDESNVSQNPLSEHMVLKEKSESFCLVRAVLRAIGFVYEGLRRATFSRSGAIRQSTIIFRDGGRVVAAPDFSAPTTWLLTISRRAAPVTRFWRGPVLRVVETPRPLHGLQGQLIVNQLTTETSQTRQ